MAYSETIQQASAESEALIANFRLTRDGCELNERLLALGIALTAALRIESMIEIEKRFLALGFITGVVSDDGLDLVKNLSALVVNIIPPFLN